MKQLKNHLKDIEYELRFLIGANRITKSLESERRFQCGNLVNYFKSSAYINVRNLYEFFTSTKQGGNDVHITDFGYSNMQSELYIKWGEAINRRVMHISPGRPRRNNAKEPINSTQLNQQLGNFTKDIVKLWKTWQTLEQDNAAKSSIRQSLQNAQNQANDDHNSFLELINK